MNKSKTVEYTEYCWNPITGPASDGSKYARRGNFEGDTRRNIGQYMAAQGMEDGGEPNQFVLDEPFRSAAGTVVNTPFGAALTLHRYRFDFPAKLKAPANILVGSLTDMFAKPVPDEWLMEVFEVCKAHPQHNYLFLTQNPRRYIKLFCNKAFPTGENFWFGTVVDTAAQGYFCMKSYPMKSFVVVRGYEALEQNWMEDVVERCDWLIIAGDGKRHTGEHGHLTNTVAKAAYMARQRNVPVFMLENVCTYLPGTYICKELPQQMKDKPKWSAKQQAHLTTSCAVCTAVRPKKEMTAILVRTQRGQHPEQWAYACTDPCIPLLEQVFYREEDITPYLKGALADEAT